MRASLQCESRYVYVADAIYFAAWQGMLGLACAAVESQDATAKTLRRNATAE